MFSEFLPIGRDHGIKFENGTHEVSLWFNEKCIAWASSHTPEEISRWINVTVHRIYVEVTTESINNDLLEYMQRRDFTRMPTQEEQPLADRYEQHGREVLSVVADGVNRLLNFARSEKGQFWLTPYQIDLENTSSYATFFRAKARLESGEPFRWNPSQISRGTSNWGENTSRFITSVEWPQVRDFVTIGKRPTLTLQLLAGAESLAESGNNRAALTEAVSALEIAINEFARSPRLSDIYPSSISERLGVESLAKVVQSLGLTGSVSLVLPLVLPDSELPGDILKSARDAINERNNIVHNGQREVPSSRLILFLKTIRFVCEKLLQFRAD
jgi:hypothetical protein